MHLLNLLLPTGVTLACVRNDTILLITKNHFLSISRKNDQKLQLNKLHQIESHCKVYTNPLIWMDTIVSFTWGRVVKYSAIDGHQIE